MGNDITNTIANTITEEATVGFFGRIFNLYGEFISVFPEKYQWIISIIIILAIAAFLWNLVRKNWIWIILVIILFPGILPILQNIFNSLAKMLIGD